MKKVNTAELSNENLITMRQDGLAFAGRLCGELLAEADIASVEAGQADKAGDAKSAEKLAETLQEVATTLVAESLQ